MVAVTIPQPPLDHAAPPPTETVELALSRCSAMKIGSYHTLGGLAMLALGRVPRPLRAVLHPHDVKNCLREWGFQLEVAGQSSEETTLQALEATVDQD